MNDLLSLIRRQKRNNKRIQRETLQTLVVIYLPYFHFQVKNGGINGGRREPNCGP